MKDSAVDLARDPNYYINPGLSLFNSATEKLICLEIKASACVLALTPIADNLNYDPNCTNYYNNRSLTKELRIRQ